MLRLRNYTAHLLSVLIIISVVFVFPGAASALEADGEKTSGVTGDCNWKLDDNGTLTISGSGEMADYISELYYKDDGSDTWDYRYTYPWNNLKVKNIIVEEGVTYIGDFAFADCTAAESVTLPNSLEEAGSAAFANTPWYGSLPDGMIYFGNTLYEYKGDNCPPAVTVKDGTKKIGAFAFEQKNDLCSVIIPEGVEVIDVGAFWFCEGLQEVYIPDSVEYIAEDAFAGSEMAVIYSYAGSCAEAYAEEHNMLYIELERENELDDPAEWTPEIMARGYKPAGDINGDNAVDIMDSLMVQKYAAGKLELTDEQLDRADVNGDWYVNVFDAMDIQKLASGKIKSFDEVKAVPWMCK